MHMCSCINVHVLCICTCCTSAYICVVNVITCMYTIIRVPCSVRPTLRLCFPRYIHTYIQHMYMYTTYIYRYRCMYVYMYVEKHRRQKGCTHLSTSIVSYKHVITFTTHIHMHIYNTCTYIQHIYINIYPYMYTYIWKNTDEELDTLTNAPICIYIRM